jgi:hypothetical protein
VVRPNQASSGNHPGIIDYKSGSYVFGFNYKLNFALTNKHHERRSVCVAKFEYNPDGTIPERFWWDDVGAPQIGTLNPFQRTEAETICWSQDIKSAANGQGGLCIYPTRDGAYIKVKGVNFGAGAKTFRAFVSVSAGEGKVELRLDRPTGPLIGTCAFPQTGGATAWATASCSVRDARGVHDLFLVFAGNPSAALRVDWWQFE